jgi:PelA/Pel-15E family pectate lyase
MHRVGICFLIVAGCLLAATFGSASQTSQPGASVKWRDCLKQPPAWYHTDEARRIAGNLLLYQRDSGGWPKNTEMAAVLTEKEKSDLSALKKSNDATIDNQSTYTQLEFLARTLSTYDNASLRSSFFRGLDYLLAAQYANGGWPQFYPHPSGYQTHITFNDDAMTGVLVLLRDVARKNPLYAFVDEARRVKAEQAVAKGIECILKCQIRVDGKLTVWCAQHDEHTFAPAPARSYEKISLSGGESVGIVRFLMGVEHPRPPVVEAIAGAVAWFQQVKLTGIAVVDRADASQSRGYDRIVIQDPNAPPLWARFYEIGTNRPIFCGRDGVVKYNFAEIEYERRTGYRWYVDSPARLLTRDYPAWLKRKS